MAITTRIVKTSDNGREVVPFLVDVPVKTNIWVRPECQKKQFEVIRKAKPSILFIQSDGGRNEKEWEIIRQHRKMYEEDVDWDCSIHYIYADENSGMYTMGMYTDKYIWEHVDRCIALEDDHIPSVSYFSFCQELLEKYKDDLRICAICGNNYTGVSENCSSDYLFSRRLAIWGIAYWKRSMEMSKIRYADDNYIIESVCRLAKGSNNFCNAVRGYATAEKVGGHIPGHEFYLNLNVFAQHQLFIFPKYNMISCWGITSGSTHAVDSIKKLSKGDAQLYYMKTYEMNEPINHPDYVFPDIEFEKRQDRIMARYHPIIAFYRRVVRICKRVWYGDGTRMIKSAIERGGKNYHNEK